MLAAIIAQRQPTSTSIPKSNLLVLVFAALFDVIGKMCAIVLTQIYNFSIEFDVSAN